MITDVHIHRFGCSVSVIEGDNLSVYAGGHLIITHVATFAATWTCSITFKLDGETNWMLGNQNTIDWLLHLHGFSADDVPSVANGEGVLNGDGKTRLTLTTN